MTLGYTRAFFTLPLLSRSLYHFSAPPTWKHISSGSYQFTDLQLESEFSPPSLLTLEYGTACIVFLKEEQRWRPSQLDRSHTESELEVLPDSDAPAQAAGTGEKNRRRKRQAAPSVLADGLAGSTRMVGALDHAQALLAGVVRAATTWSAPRFA